MSNLTCAPVTYLALAIGLASAGCGGDEEIDSNEAARRAYLGLDDSIAKSITLGFAGFNAASSANIDPQMTAGTAGGTLTVTGQVDQGSSANKGMRLYVGMVNYDDGNVAINTDGDTVHIVYNTDTATATQPYLSMQLKGIPTGTLDGTLMGIYHLTGDLAGDLTLNIAFAGALMAGAGNEVLRVPGTTMVTGTATNSDGGVYNISLSI